ncbi:MAG: hypothetical protein ACQKBY_12705 [Verrucomicrobiales bacterium]
MNRRQTLQLLTATALSSPLLARESYGRWDDESMAEYTSKLITWLQTNFAERAARIEEETGEPHLITYDYLNLDNADRKKKRLFERYLQGRLSDKDTLEHTTQALDELENIRSELAKAEEKAAAAWQPPHDQITVKNGRIFDAEITAGRLCVVLDNSRSMAPYLPKLREEIAKDFTHAYIVETSGCHLDRPADAPWFFAAPARGVNPFTADRFLPQVPRAEQNPHAQFIGWTRSTPSALTAMINLMHADAIYWFCDFDDDDQDSVITEFGQLLLAKKVKLHVHTLAKRPPKLLMELIERSEGSYQRKRI